MEKRMLEPLPAARCPPPRWGKCQADQQTVGCWGGSLPPPPQKIKHQLPLIVNMKAPFALGQYICNDLEKYPDLYSESFLREVDRPGIDTVQGDDTHICRHRKISPFARSGYLQ